MPYQRLHAVHTSLKIRELVMTATLRKKRRVTPQRAIRRHLPTHAVYRRVGRNSANRAGLPSPIADRSPAVCTGDSFILIRTDSYRFTKYLDLDQPSVNIDYRLAPACGLPQVSWSESRCISLRNPSRIRIMSRNFFYTISSPLRDSMCGPASDLFQK